MNIALIGYGKMGHEIEKIAIERGHTIVSIIDKDNVAEFDSPAFKSADVAIEFSMPDSAFENYKKCFLHNIPVVAGTTGWLDKMEHIKAICADENKTFFYASNYSIGVNILFEINTYLARIMDRYPIYNVRMEETHHIHKLDAPSGTALTLAEGIIDNVKRKERWNLDNECASSDISIHAIRKGEVPGIHEVVYESAVDTISIKHDAKSRSGFALGAVVAAEFVKGKSGFLTMNDLLKF